MGVTEHTPTPWERTNLTIHTKSTVDDASYAIARVLQSGVETMAAKTVRQATANAAFIVEAVNNYEELVDSLKRNIGVLHGLIQVIEDCLPEAKNIPGSVYHVEREEAKRAETIARSILQRIEKGE